MASLASRACRGRRRRRAGATARCAARPSAGAARVPRIEDSVDAPVCAEDLVDGLPQHLFAAASREILALALVGESQGECTLGQTDNLDVVEQHQPRESAL